MWQQHEIGFELFAELSGDKVVTAQITTPDGVILMMAELEQEHNGRRLKLMRFHAQGLGVGSNSVGHANLRVLVRKVMEEMDYDELVVEGAPRTSGANPGRTPRVLRFTRGPVPAPQASP
jgi:hypothetical protein